MEPLPLNSNSDALAQNMCDFPELFSRESSRLVEPTVKWPNKVTSAQIEKVPTSKLKFDEHFKSKPISESTWSEVVQQKLTKYYKNVAKENYKPLMLAEIPLTAGRIKR